MGGESTRARVWERFYIAISREIALLPPYHPKVRQNRPPGDIARERRLTARLQIDARPSRNGFEQFGSGTQAYGQFEPAAWSCGPK